MTVREGKVIYNQIRINIPFGHGNIAHPLRKK